MENTDRNIENTDLTPEQMVDFVLDFEEELKKELGKICQ